MVSMSSAVPRAFAAGKFHITPLARLHAGGHHTASLSIRRGKGSQTHDRVYTFKPAFKTHESALMYATALGRYWLINPDMLG